jgi:hypothetical protein
MTICAYRKARPSQTAAERRRSMCGGWVNLGFGAEFTLSERRKYAAADPAG